MNYFKDCKTQDEVKRLYRDWANRLHPDKGGKVEEMVELTRQYNDSIRKFYNKFERSSTMNEDEKNEYFRKGQQEFHREYGGYSGYRYNTVNDMKQEYYKQRENPILTYERMKGQYESIVQGNINLQSLIRELQIENEKLKKKVQTQKRRLEKLSNMPKNSKKSSKQSSVSL